MKRPTIAEYDTGSYLDASLTAHAVLAGDEATGFLLDGSPSYDFEQLNLAPDLCREHAYDLARSIGFVGPTLMSVRYDSGGALDRDQVLVRRDDSGRITLVASYAYGRAYFEPGEPRTAPCQVCGAETLVDAGGYDDGVG